MKAMQINKLGEVTRDSVPLDFTELEIPAPGKDDILIKVSVCGVCHTELDEIEGRTPPPQLPVIPGHQVVGEVVQMGRKVKEFSIGDRVGVAWISSACGIAGGVIGLYISYGLLDLSIAFSAGFTTLGLLFGMGISGAALSATTGERGAVVNMVFSCTLIMLIIMFMTTCAVVGAVIATLLVRV